ncbi:MAG: serine--tRNA ligase [Oligoflexia bacterium]|nr:serine--tRNA ligase [Oligoflexia bacterium]
MLDIKKIMAAPEDVKKNLSMRGFDITEIDRVLAVNETRRHLISKSETLKAQQNKVNQEIAQLKKNKQDASVLLEQMKELSGEVKRLEAESGVRDEEVQQLLMRIPNTLHESVPRGQSAEQNKVVRTWGDKPKIVKPSEHWEIGERLNILDFERAGRVTGARFTFVRSHAAKLERALVNFMLDTHTTEHGYEEMIPPFMVNRQSLIGTSQLPKFEEDLFKLEKTDYFLIPTAEVPVTNFYREEILSEDQLPIAFAAYSPCFRAEAGSYGKDTKGLIRQHQFNKVEIVRLSHPTKSYEQLEVLTSHAEKILQALGLHYRVVSLCSGDTGFGSAKTYDLEVWLPGQDAYREISSCSNFEDFQARRAGIRFKPKDGGKPQFVHTLNGSGLAVGRTLVALLENGLQADGSVIIPQVLKKYCGFDRIPSLGP